MTRGTMVRSISMNICIGELCQRVSVEFVGGGIFGLTRNNWLGFNGSVCSFPRLRILSE